jgi:GAF domain-containing protein
LVRFPCGRRACGLQSRSACARRTIWAENQPLTFDRRGELEFGYFTYAYSPILDDRERVGGVLLVTRDATARVLADRRIDALQALAERTMDSATQRQACEQAALALGAYPELSFTLI